MWILLVLVLSFLSLTSPRKLPVYLVTEDVRFHRGVFGGYDSLISENSLAKFRKCCPFGEEITDRKCKIQQQSDIYVEAKILPFNINIGNHCSKANSTRIMIEVDKENDYIDLSDGSLHSVSYKGAVSKKDYCFDFIDGIFRALVCYDKKDEKLNSYYLMGK